MEFIGNIDYDIKVCDADEIVICGCGKMMPLFLEKLKIMKILHKVVAVSDENSSLWGSKLVNDIPVHSYVDVIKKYPNADYIVYNQFAREICEKLYGKVDKIHVILKW